jgi:replicative DNA helicase
VANPVTLKHFFHESEALRELGGGEYLARLAAASAMVVNVRDYSEVIMDLAVKRSLIDIGSEVVHEAYNQDVDITAVEQIEKAEQHLFDLATTGDSRSGFVPFRAASNTAITQANLAFKRKGTIIGVPTGLRDLDNLLGGLQDSDLLILAGRPSMGKTALATTIAYQAALRFQRDHEESDIAQKSKPKSVGFFSLEMSAEQLANRVLAARSRVQSNRILRGDMTDEEFEKLLTADQELASLPCYIDDTPALTISALRTRARRLKRTQNLGLLVVDYLQLVRGSSASSQQNRVNEVSEITQGLKAIAKELNLPVIALSQLSRAVEQREDKRPQLSDLRESGSIEQDADVVMFVYREQYYVERKMPSDETSAEYAAWNEHYQRVMNKAEVIIAKQRHGPIGHVLMQFQGEFARFHDLADDDHLPQRYE